MTKRRLMIGAWHIFAITTIATAVALVGLVFYWTVPNRQPFTFYTDKLPVTTPVVKAGEYVEWVTDFTQNYNGQRVSVDRALENGVAVFTPTTSYITKKGRSTINRRQEIPDYVPSGTYHIKITNYVRINPMKTVVVIRYTDEFQIVNETERVKE